MNGIDVSRYQDHWRGKPDWKTISEGVYGDFAFMKATEGIGWRDPSYPRNYSGAKENGIPAGAYHYFHPKYSGQQQADWFLSYTRDSNHELPMAVDLEATDGMGAGTIKSRVKVFVDAIIQATGKVPFMYSRKYWLDANFYNPPPWATAMPLWLAAYTYNVKAKPLLPKGWPDWVVWQWSDKGKIPGIKSNVDLDKAKPTLLPLMGIEYNQEKENTNETI